MAGQKAISTDEFDARFDAGEELDEHLAWEDAVVSDPATGEVRPVSLVLPEWVVRTADAEARAINISRRAVLNSWLAEKARSIRAAT